MMFAQIILPFGVLYCCYLPLLSAAQIAQDQEICEVRCDDGTCISNGGWCDYYEDCPDGSDEKYCLNSGNLDIQCNEQLHFRCDNNECIPKSAVCDDYDDCQDYSDEKSCMSDNCDHDEFECGDESCILKTKVCDGTEDCTDGSDEDNCLEKNKGCGAEEFKCSSSDACILKSKWCDGKVDCSDGSDEESCGRSKKECDKDEFKCDDDECIPKFKYCDGHADCADWSDEEVSCQEPFEKEIDELATITIHQEEQIGAALAIEKATEWLLSQRESGFNWKQDTPRAIVALTLAQTTTINETEYQLATQHLLSDIAVDLMRNNSGSEIPIYKLARYVTALVASCGNPRNFHGYDLVDSLRVQADKILKNEYVSPGIFLALCVANQSLANDFHIVYTMLYSHVAPRRRNGQFHDLEAYAAVVASCMIKNDNVELFRNLLNRTVLTYISDVKDGDTYTIALLVQALNAWSSDPIARVLKNERETLMRTLLRKQQSDGSFGDFLATYYALPALNGKSFANLKGLKCFERSSIAPYYHYPFGRGMVVSVSISLWVTTPYGTEVNSMTLNVLSIWTLFDAMKLAAAKNPLYKFDHEETSVGKVVYRISDLPNDSEGETYWNFYINQLSTGSANGMTSGDSDFFRKLRATPYTSGVENHFLKENDNIVAWYMPTY